MTPYYADDLVTVYHGDCVQVMPQLPESSVDAIVTDPPYDLTSIVRRFGGEGAAPAKPEGMGGAFTRLTKGFMGQTWDGTGVAFRVETWTAALRVLRPGGHLLAFGGTRTSHRMVVAIEDAGFEIRDTLTWLYGSGWPKGHSHLKPAYEPIVLARKPLAAGSVAANVLAHGTGALNVDGCRIDTPGNVTFERGPGDRSREQYRTGTVVGGAKPAEGRWPANVVLSHSPECREAGTRRVRADGGTNPNRRGGRIYGGGAGIPPNERTNYADADGYETVTAWECAEGCAVALLDAQSGERKSGAAVRGDEPSSPSKHAYGKFGRVPGTVYADTGGASRFFYTSKASASERQGVTHPTVKPVSLMSWLTRLVCPPGGVLLDPFAGSGTTGVAATLEGFRAILIEQKADYLPMITKRLVSAQRQAARQVRVVPWRDTPGLPAYDKPGIAQLGFPADLLVPDLETA